VHAVAGAAAVQVDLVVTLGLADTCRLGQRRRIAAAKLQGYRVFFGIEAQEFLAVAAQYGAGRDHLRI
jgi:hypothetical protein